MVNAKEKILKDVEYEEEKPEKAKEIKKSKFKIARHNKSLEKNSQFGEF